MKKFLEEDLSQKNQVELADCYGGQTKQFFRKFNKNQAYLFKAINRHPGIFYLRFFNDLDNKILDSEVMRDHEFYLSNIKLIRAVKARNGKDASAIFTILEEQLYYCEKCRIQCPFNVFLHSKDFVDYEYLEPYSFYLSEPKYVNSFVSFFLKISGNNLCFDDLKVEDFIRVLKANNLSK